MKKLLTTVTTVGILTTSLMADLSMCSSCHSKANNYKDVLYNNPDMETLTQKLEKYKHPMSFDNKPNWKVKRMKTMKTMALVLNKDIQDSIVNEIVQNSKEFKKTLEWEKGIVHKQTDLSVDETVEKMEKKINKIGGSLFKVVDLQSEGKKHNIELPYSKLLLFGNPKVGLVMLKENMEVGLTVPLEILVYEKDGKTIIVYKDINSYSEVKKIKHFHKVKLSGAQNLVSYMGKRVKTITNAKTKKYTDYVSERKHFDIDYDTFKDSFLEDKSILTLNHGVNGRKVGHNISNATVSIKEKPKTYQLLDKNIENAVLGAFKREFIYDNNGKTTLVSKDINIF